MSGDSIWHYARPHGWCHSEMWGDEPRYGQIHAVMTWRDEWTYAWKNLQDGHYPFGYKTRRYECIVKTL